jgi:hypothetical protein
LASEVEMTFTWDQELAAPVRYIAEYEDGSRHVFQVHRSTLVKVYLVRGGTASLASLLTNGSRMGT